MRILLAEDDQFLAGGLRLALKQNGYSVDHVLNGLEADIALAEVTYDLLILDLGLPAMDGVDVLKRARSRGDTLPVMIVTARDRLEDRVTGLDLGANDYITKPFELPEFEARVRALLRRSTFDNKVEITHGPLRFDTVSREVWIDTDQLDLSSREVAVLELLLQRPGRVVGKRRLSEHLSSWDIELTYNALEIVISRLRKKLIPARLTIRSVRGIGYSLTSQS